MEMTSQDFFETGKKLFNYKLSPKDGVCIIQECSEPTDRSISGFQFCENHGDFVWLYSPDSYFAPPGPGPDFGLTEEDKELLRSVNYYSFQSMLEKGKEIFKLKPFFIAKEFVCKVYECENPIGKVLINKENSHHYEWQYFNNRSNRREIFISSAYCRKHEDVSQAALDYDLVNKPTIKQGCLTSIFLFIFSGIATCYLIIKFVV